jgi:hypothetical protein
MCIRHSTSSRASIVSRLSQPGARASFRKLDTSKNRVFEACCSDVELMNDRGG